MKPVPRSVNLALAELFKHPLSRVVPNPCVAEYTGGLTKFGTPTTPRGDNFTAEQLTKEFVERSIRRKIFSESFRDDGRRDPVCYSAYFCRHCLVIPSPPTSSTKR